MPKALKMNRFRRNFSEFLDKLPNLRQFCNAVTRDALLTARDREAKYNQEVLQEAKRIEQ